MKIIKTNFEFDKTNHITYCHILCDNNQIFIGEAFCHNDDLDMYSERTGAEIAHRRAWIKMLRHIRDCEIRPVVEAYRHLYKNMTTSKHFNPKSYENRMLRRQLRIFEKDLARLQNELAYERKNLKDYINGKEKIWQSIRAKNEDKLD